MKKSKKSAILSILLAVPFLFSACTVKTKTTASSSLQRETATTQRRTVPSAELSSLTAEEETPVQIPREESTLLQGSTVFFASQTNTEKYTEKVTKPQKAQSSESTVTSTIKQSSDKQPTTVTTAKVTNTQTTPTATQTAVSHTTEQVITHTIKTTLTATFSQKSTVTATAKPSQTCQVHVTVHCRNAVNYGISHLPQSGIMVQEDVVTEKGESALSALKKVLNKNGIPIGESRGYIKEIGGLKEKDCGGTSGWMYAVNGETPMVSAEKYSLADGDSVVFYYVTEYGESYQ